MVHLHQGSVGCHRASGRNRYELLVGRMALWLRRNVSWVIPRVELTGSLTRWPLPGRWGLWPLSGRRHALLPLHRRWTLLPGQSRLQSVVWCNRRSDIRKSFERGWEERDDAPLLNGDPPLTNPARPDAFRTQREDGYTEQLKMGLLCR